jgi:hypothetical protein
MKRLVRTSPAPEHRLLPIFFQVASFVLTESGQENSRSGKKYDILLGRPFTDALFSASIAERNVETHEKSGAKFVRCLKLKRGRALSSASIKLPPES